MTVKADKANYGVSVTEDLKYTGESESDFCASLTNVCTVRFSRQNSVHVSPTVLWDGVADPEVSSKWKKNDWLNWVEKKLGKPVP